MSAYSDKSDAQLAEFIIQGNHAAFAELVARHTDMFFALALRTLQHQSDAEDVVQTAFIKFWQRPQLWCADKAKFTTWFYRVVINGCHDHQRKYRREELGTPESFENVMPPSPSEESRAFDYQEQRWRQMCLESGIRRLPSQQRDALNLVVYSGLPQKQAAEVLGISLKALESLLVRAKKNLHKHMKTLENKVCVVKPTSEKLNVQ